MSWAMAVVVSVQAFSQYTAMIESVFGLVGNSCYLLIPCSCVLTCSEDNCVWNGLDKRRHVNGLPSVRGERLDSVFWLDRACICNVAFACFVPHNILRRNYHNVRNNVNKQASIRVCEAWAWPYFEKPFCYFPACWPWQPAQKVSCLTNFKLRVI